MALNILVRALIPYNDLPAIFDLISFKKSARTNFDNSSMGWSYYPSGDVYRKKIFYSF